MSKIATLLQTKNTKEQEERINQLIQIASAPVIDLVIRLDTRNGELNFTLIGAQLGPQDVHRILDGAKEKLRQMEIEALQKNDEPVEEEIKEPDIETG